MYQQHLPDRYVPRFGETVYEPNKERETVPIAEQLTVFADLIKAPTNAGIRASLLDVCRLAAQFGGRLHGVF